MPEPLQPAGPARGPAGAGWPDDDPAAQEVPQISAINRIWRVLVAPQETFRAIAAQPTWGTVLVLSVVVVTAFWVFQAQRIDFAELMRQQFEQQGKPIPPGAERVAGVQRILSPIFAGVFAIVIPLVVAAVMLALNLFGGKLRYSTSFSVALHSGIPALLKALLTLPVVYARESLTLVEAQSGLLKSNLAAFASEETGPRLTVLLANLDVFSFWWIGLMILGYSVAAKVSKAKAAALVVGGWAAMILFSMLLAGLRPS